MHSSEKKRAQNYKKMVNEYYDMVTKPYLEVWGTDSFHPFFWNEGRTREEAISETNQHIIKKGNVGIGSVVADYGCGVGTLSILLSEVCKHVTALNFNEKQLRMAQKRAVEKGCANIQFFQEDIMRSERSEEFDAVYLIDVEPHLPDKKEAMKIIYKALKPGGRLVMTAWLTEDKVSEAARLMLVEPFNIGWSFPYLETNSNYMAYFKNLGFKIIEAEDWHDRITDCINDAYERALVKIKNYSTRDLFRLFDFGDFSLFKKVFKLEDTALIASYMPLYSKAMQDAGIFRLYFYVLEKPKE